MKKAELQKMCDQKGYSTTGLVRADLLKLLKQSDVAEGGGSDNDDNQPGNESVDGEDQDEGGEDEESEPEQDGDASVDKKILLLKLEIELAKLKGAGKKVGKESSKEFGDSFRKETSGDDRD